MCSKTLYREAVSIQNACNIIAVAKLLSDTTLALRHDDFLGNPQLNAHPAVILIINKLAEMVDVENMTDFCDAYQECIELGEEK